MAAILVSQDTAPTISATLSNSEGVLDLTGCDVFFQMRLVNEKRWKINAECLVEAPTTGVVTYALQPEDLDFAGECQARFLVIYPDDTRQHTVPATSITVEAQ